VSEPGDKEGLVVYQYVRAVERVSYMGRGKRRWENGCQLPHWACGGEQDKDPRWDVGVGNTSGGTEVTCDVVAGGAGVFWKCTEKGDCGGRDSVLVSTVAADVVAAVVDDGGGEQK